MSCCKGSVYMEAGMIRGFLNQSSQSGCVVTGRYSSLEVMAWAMDRLVSGHSSLVGSGSVLPRHVET